MTRRFYYQAVLHENGMGTLALLPRIRLTAGPTVGIGFQWLTVWAHVWLWEWRGRLGTYKWWRDRGCMWDLLPHLWVHWSRHGSGIHLWWLKWRWHHWFYQSETSNDG